MGEVCKTDKYVRTGEQQDKPLLRPGSQKAPAMHSLWPTIWQCILGLFPELNKKIPVEDMTVTL